MWIQQFIFFAFAFVTLGAAVVVITSNNPIRSVLCLVLAFFSSAGLWILAQAEFLALILILVYVGAVMTLFLFMVMMLNIDVATVKGKFKRYLPFVVLLSGVMVLLLLLAIKPDAALFTAGKAALKAVDYSNTKALGEVLYTVYAYPFIVAGAILLSAIIAATVLTHRPPQNCKTQDPVAQMRVKRRDRVRLVKM